MSSHQWTSAFLIFMNMYIYTEKLPLEFANLLKYCFTVRKIGSSNGDNAWRYCDENFRKLRQSHKVPWQVPITEYMVKTSTLTHSFRPSSYTQYSARSPRHFCFSYNNGKKCKNSPCSFKHMCHYAMASTPKSTATSQTKTKKTPRISVPTTIKHDALLQELPYREATPTDIKNNNSAMFLQHQHWQTESELRDIPDALLHKYLPYDPTLRQNQRANAFNKGSYLHSLKIINHFDNTVSLTENIYRSMKKLDPPPLTL